MNKKVYSFSQPKSFNLFFTHINKLFYMVIVVGVLYTYQDLKGHQLNDIIILVGIISIVLVLFAKFIAKIIWRLDVDFNEEKIVFYLCRKDAPIHVFFHEIEYIKVNGPIIFYFQKKKILYSTNQYEEILFVLNKIKKIQWGGMCDSLGPDKSVRDSVDRENLQR